MNKFEKHLKNSQVVYGNTFQAEVDPISAHAEIQSFRDKDYKKKHYISTAQTTQEIDFSILPMASESYHISADPKDYVIVPLGIVSCDIPNRNTESFSVEEVSFFDPRYGMPVYKTFINKPTHKDHINSDPTKALGMHLDATLEYVNKFDVWKISVLTIWDRTKDTKRVREIMNKNITGYSMGAFVDCFSCSICGAMDVNVKPCEHGVGGWGRTFGDQKRMAFKNLLSVCFFETSSVASPADDTAFSSDVFV